MIQRKLIKLSRRDGILLKWIACVSEQNSKKVNYLIKQALISYITKRKFIDIGRIHYNPSCEDGKLEPAVINLWVKDSQIIQEWLTSLNDNKINVSVMVREIIRKSISIIPESVETWIPEFYDFDDYRVNLKTTDEPIVHSQANIQLDADSLRQSSSTTNNNINKESVVDDSILTSIQENSSSNRIRKNKSGLSGKRVKKS